MWMQAQGLLWLAVRGAVPVAGSLMCGGPLASVCRAFCQVPCSGRGPAAFGDHQSFNSRTPRPCKVMQGPLGSCKVAAVATVCCQGCLQAAPPASRGWLFGDALLLGSCRGGGGLWYRPTHMYGMQGESISGVLYECASCALVRGAGQAVVVCYCQSSPDGGRCLLCLYHMSVCIRVGQEKARAGIGTLRALPPWLVA